MTKPRGRGSSPIRPGILVKSILSGQTPLEAHGMSLYVEEASINDLHNTYKTHIKRLNYTREKKLSCMTYRSWVTWFTFARLLGLVEKVREEPMDYPPAQGDLLTIEKARTLFHVVKAHRSIYKLTDVGKTDEKSWLDCTRAWKEGWEPGQKADIFEMPALPLISPVELMTTPDPTELNKLLKQLELLIAYPNKDIIDELAHILIVLQKWITSEEENIDISADLGLHEDIKFHKAWVDGLVPVSESLMDADLRGAIANIKLLKKATAS